jgi:hypothetical protein
VDKTVVFSSQVLHQVIQTGVTEVDFEIDDPEPSSLSPLSSFSPSMRSIGELERPDFGASFREDTAAPTAVFRLLDAGPGHLANSPGWRRVSAWDGRFKVPFPLECPGFFLVVRMLSE